MYRDKFVVSLLGVESKCGNKHRLPGWCVTSHQRKQVERVKVQCVCFLETSLESTPCSSASRSLLVCITNTFEHCHLLILDLTVTENVCVLLQTLSKTQISIHPSIHPLVCLSICPSMYPFPPSFLSLPFLPSLGFHGGAAPGCPSHTKMYRCSSHLRKMEELLA